MQERGWLYLERFITMPKIAMIEDNQVESFVFINSHATRFFLKDGGQCLRAAGKGGIIKRITERVSPRVFRVVALPTPSDREKSQLYIQRYIAHMPAAGEIVLFDRSWYNRAGVERGLEFCTRKQY